MVVQFRWCLPFSVSATTPFSNDSEITFDDRDVLERLVGIGTFGRSFSGWCTVSEFLCG